MKFILRLFPEISIKSRPVRNRLIKLLSQNILNVAKHRKLECHVYSQWDKLVVRFGEKDDMSMREQAIRELSRIPGIHSFLEVDEFEFKNFDDIFEHAKVVYGDKLQNKTFAVRVKRRGNHEFSSQQAERIIGGMFKQNFANNGVNLSHPDITINIEIDSEKAFIITGKHVGLGGYPVSSQGDALSLISGGFDSGVSTYRVIRRGCRVNYLFFNMGGTAHEIGVKQESYFIRDRFSSSHRVKFITIPFEEIVGQILERTHHGVRGVILKRMMMRVGALVASKIGAQALVTGESLGQVSSQTLINLSHIDSVTDTLILRPLVVDDKQDIIDEASAIGTAGFAENMPEYCGVISDHPNVCPTLSFVEEEEAKLDPDLVEKAVAISRFIDIKEIPEDTKRLKTDVEVETELKRGEVVLDVRSPDDAEKSPLHLTDNECVLMPFYKTAKDFASLDQLKTYVLYCDQGVMSLMQARQLKEMGYHNVKVWRPE